MRARILAFFVAMLWTGMSFASVVEWGDVQVCHESFTECEAEHALTTMPWWTGLPYTGVEPDSSYLPATYAASEWVAANRSDVVGEELTSPSFAFFFDPISFVVQSGRAVQIVGITEIYEFVDFGEGDAGWAYAEPLTSVPIPSTLALFGLGLAGIGFARRRKQ